MNRSTTTLLTVIQRVMSAASEAFGRADTQWVIRHGWRADLFGGTAVRSGLRGLPKYKLHAHPMVSMTFCNVALLIRRAVQVGAALLAIHCAQTTATTAYQGQWLDNPNSGVRRDSPVFPTYEEALQWTRQKAARPIGAPNTDPLIITSENIALRFSATHPLTQRPAGFYSHDAFGPHASSELLGVCRV